MRKITLFIVIISILALLAAGACSSDGDGDNNGGDNNTSTHDLTMAVTGSGSTSPSAGTHAYDEGEVVDIIANAATGWEFDSWSGDVADADSASTTVTMDSDKTVTANFTETAASEQWAAYAFDETVSPASGTPGTVKSFTIEETYIDEGVTRRFRIDSEYLGTETAEIKTQKMDMSTFETTTVTNSIDCYKIKHRVTVLEAAAGDDNPEWADITVWIPTGEFETTVLSYWIYPKAIYEDSDGNTGEWDYYLTQAMLDEMDGGTASYMFYTDGDFYGYDQWTLMGLYGWAWTWFSPYATGGDEYLEEGSWGMGGYSYSCSSETEDIGDYTFDTWNLEITWSYGGDSAEYSGIFSPDLPVPIYLKVGASGGGSQNYFQYELTDLVLE